MPSASTMCRLSPIVILNMDSKERPSTNVIDALRANHNDLQEFVDSLTGDEWQMASACEGWRVQDVFAHVTSNLKQFADPDPPSDEQDQLSAEEAMEALVSPRKDWSPDELIEEYYKYLEPALNVFSNLIEEPTASVEQQLSDLGTYQLRWLPYAFCFDHYCHLRHDMTSPGGPIERDLPSADDLRLAPGIEWMLAGLPQMCSKDLTSLKKPVLLSLTGPGGGKWVLHNSGENELIQIDNYSEQEVSASITSTSHDFVSWATHRSSWEDYCSLDGDLEYVSSLIGSINII
ncbi:MAG: hypothetical protein CL469_02385 [Acidimicrobiaceae bacterium]|nr:hypothetical protein [Acidimicrobiaceae bacterium]